MEQEMTPPSAPSATPTPADAPSPCPEKGQAVPKLLAWLRELADAIDMPVTAKRLICIKPVVPPMRLLRDAPEGVEPLFERTYIRRCGVGVGLFGRMETGLPPSDAPSPGDPALPDPEPDHIIG